MFIGIPLVNWIFALLCVVVGNVLIIGFIYILIEIIKFVYKLATKEKK